MVTESHEKFEKSILASSFEAFPAVDWFLLGQAVNYYKSMGYIYRETPWVIPEEYSKVTKPHNNESFQMSKDIFLSQPHELVGSAEQGFLYLLINNLLAPGKYLSVSPCFRVDTYDQTHLPWFMKIELFAVGEEEKNYKQMLHDAFNFFSQYSQPQIIEIPDGSSDINVNNIEVGSYGVRAIKDIKYAYGTGLALPRFSIAN